jgi:acetate kinase
VKVLVVNAGSSSLKLAVVDGDQATHTQSIDPADTHAVLARLLDEQRPDAVGHRVVHGGADFTGPALVDDGVLDRIERLRALAPLHQGPALDALRQARAALGGVPQVACFDTAFHATMPRAAHTYAVPQRWRDELGVRRYGFHGLAHEWAARRAAEHLGRRDLRVVNAHLGSGASLCAIQAGRSVDTTMGFTPVDGLVMGTRCGELDPAVPLWLVDQGLDRAEVSDALERHSGLLALAGTADAQKVEAAAEAGDPDAVAALDVWAHRLRAGVAAMAAAMGGLDVLTFSGGIGEHAPAMRTRAVAGLEFLGITLDAARNNQARSGDAELSDDRVRVLVVEAREDLIVAEQVRATLS